MLFSHHFPGSDEVPAWHRAGITIHISFFFLTNCQIPQIVQSELGQGKSWLRQGRLWEKKGLALVSPSDVHKTMAWSAHAVPQPHMCPVRWMCSSPSLGSHLERHSGLEVCRSWGGLSLWGRWEVCRASEHDSQQPASFSPTFQCYPMTLLHCIFVSAMVHYSPVLNFAQKSLLYSVKTVCQGKVPTPA